MTDYNSMKADEYAQRLGEMDEMDNAIDEMVDVVTNEVPEWMFEFNSETSSVSGKIYCEAKRRVMQAIKERGDP